MKNLLLLSTCMVATSTLLAQSAEVIWYNGKSPVTYTLQAPGTPVIQVALDMFREDISRVTGRVPAPTTGKNGDIRILQLNRNNSAELKRLGVPVDSMTGLMDAFFIKANGNQLLVAGSDARGTAYGILELSRLAGVSPWVWWGDVTPEKKQQLSVPADYRTLQAPTVAYRGIFINDEDWSLRPWSSKNYAPQADTGIIAAQTYKQVFKLLLRLRANTIWPAMHTGTVAFYFTKGAKEMADSCGIVIGTSHCEPLMRNNVDEWKENQRGHFNYIDNHDAVVNYWTERLKEVKLSENFFTIGMRGVHDGSMEGVKTLKEKTDALQRVIYEQRELLTKYINPDLKKIPQQFVPYKEVLEIYENGLQVPEDVMLTWCDDNYGYMTRLSDSVQQKRSGGAGVYYHLSYWGRPHDYLWLTTTQHGLIYNEMREAYDHQARRLWVTNVHDPKIAGYDLEFFLDLAWNINDIPPNTIQNKMRSYLVRDFGKAAGEQLYPAMQEFSRLCGIRRPEFMGWSKVEEDKAKYERGWTPVINTAFSETEFGGELDRYLNSYEQIKNTLAEVEKNIPADKQDAFFARIKYPVFGAAAMATKWLEAQRARSIAADDQPDSLALQSACYKSQQAYEEIVRLTDHYNNVMAAGKWKHAMNAEPRDLPVFRAPELPLKVVKSITPVNQPALPLHLEGVIAANAADYTKVTGKVQVIQSLGHSMQAVALPKGASISYDFDADQEGPAVLRTAVIPTQPNDKGDIRFSVTIDEGRPTVCSFKEPYRSEKWKEHVMRGQAVKVTSHHLSKGRHTLTITALDNHVVVDQWMIDFKPERQFYMFPVGK
ncbi:glycosyl hydrolase 115 family protein [Chitinophaga sp. sic0106]|uniref:glycosyl hydrolase 115 family protein n=1 Tax=Chitinophaga sp. sic0106 TaxID=2854785 RepID=UPI001C4693E9|nr:glycosyl hydrolase 115 family protein [Chitinophaga sp. sic0106]MBV7530857.1 glycosyl hydrolase 115 family protein [Chitinophaga sp. sic0106]